MAVGRGYWVCSRASTLGRHSGVQLKALASLKLRYAVNIAVKAYQSAVTVSAY